MLIQIAKIKLEAIIRNLPEMVDIEDAMSRLYLLEKIEAGKADIREGRTLSHDQAVERLSRKWQS
jgi:predicted transcriptional regulator